MGPFLSSSQRPAGGKLIKLVVAILLFVNSISITNAQSLTEDAKTAKLIRDWSILLGDMIASSFGFLSPPGCARAFSMLTTAEWNAVACFSTDMIPVVVARYPDMPDPELLEVVRVERIEAEVRKAVSIAAFLTLAEIFDKSIPCMGGAQRDAAYPLLETRGLSLLKKFGSVKRNSTAGAVQFLMDRAKRPTVAGITTNKTIAYLHSRRNDGMNSRGDLSLDGICYSDYTLYQAVNPAQVEIGRTTCSAINSLDKYQNLRVPGGPTGKLRPWLAPYMARVIPFTDETSMLWQNLNPPPSRNHTEFAKQNGEVLDISSKLNDRDKVVAEFWADGPHSNLPPGHWHDIAIEESEKRGLNADDTLRLLFLQGNAVFDAGVAAWTAKRMYDSARPISVLQCLYKDMAVKAWRGPYLGVGNINGSNWMPYQDESFVTPPFAEFVSGHSTFSAASAFVIRSFLGSDEYGGSYTIKAGESKFEPKIDDPSNPKFVAGRTNVPNQGPETEGYVPSADVVLSWPTFTAAAEEAGFSRLVGGIHIAAGNDGGLDLGHMVGEAVWKRYQSLLDNSSGVGRRKLHNENHKSNIRGTITNRD